MSDLMRRLGVALPIIQAPMAGSDSVAMCAAVSEAGGLGSLACALLTPDGVRHAVEHIRSKTENPFNLNFFCHEVEVDDLGREHAWRARLAPYFAAAGLLADATAPFSLRLPFDTEMCSVVEAVQPRVVSFHFGLPTRDLLDRVRATGALLLASATTVEEAKWLEDRGVDAIIAQGAEAGGHRGLFLSRDISTQVGLFALLPQVTDSVRLPVVAAGGIADGRGVAAALILGAEMAQIGTAYLFCPEANLNARHAEAIYRARDDNTALTNLFSGRPARGVMNRLMREMGPINHAVPAFPLSGRALAPLRAKAEAEGRDDFTNLWAGQAAALSPRLPAADLTRKLARDAAYILEAKGNILWSR